MVPDHCRAGSAAVSSVVLETASLDSSLPGIGGGCPNHQLRLHRAQSSLPSSTRFASTRAEAAVAGRRPALAAAAGPLARANSTRADDLAPARHNRVCVSTAVDSGYLEPAVARF